MVKIAASISQFADHHLNQIPDHSAVKVLSTAVMLLATKEPTTKVATTWRLFIFNTHLILAAGTQVPQGLLDRVGRKLQEAEAGINDVPIVVRYNQKYSEEIDINAKFNLFALRLQRSYNGEVVRILAALEGG